MARIPDEEINRLRREVSVERLAEAHAVKLHRDGAELLGVCPFHEDDGSKLIVSPKANTWRCDGCGGGAGIEWVMKANGVSFRHAAELLTRDYPALLTTSEGITAPPTRSTTTKLPTIFERDATDEDLLVRVVDFYHATLTESPEALGYLASRGLNSTEMISTFRLGFANRTLGYRLPEKHRREGEQLRGRLQKLGILRDTGHEHFNGSIVVPTFDAENKRVASLYGRKITARLRDGTPLHLCSPDPPRGVWNELGLVGGEVVLCHSFIDALTFWCHRVRNVTATCGTGGLPEDHCAVFERYGVKRVHLAFRRDKQGDATAEKIGAELNAVGIETLRIAFPKGMDANDYATAGKSLEEAVRRAEWVARGKVEENAPTPVLVDAEESAAATTPTKIAKPAALDAPMVATNADEMIFTSADRRWRIRGLERNTSHGNLRVNILVSRELAGFHIDTVDLYVAKQRATFIKQAAIEIGASDEVIKKELGHVLLELEARVDEQIRAKLAPVETKPSMTDAERDDALGLLRDPKLAERIGADFERCGLVGEESNKLLGYIAAVSRKLEEPLAVVVQSSSAAGKSSLMDAVLDFVPEEERVSYSAMTGQSLFYMGERDLRHKVLAIAEGEGAARAAYPLKLLQSEGHLTIASTGKDAVTGKLVTHEYKVTGPVATFLTTTAIDLDEELTNRCIVLAVDEGREQTRRVHAKQRTGQTLAGMLARSEREQIIKVHRNAQRLVRFLLVVNPFAENMSFSDGRTRARRDHAKLLTLVRAVALLHQHQRDVKLVELGGKQVEYIEATAADVELATKLLAEVLVWPGDDLPPVTMSVLVAIEGFVRERAITANVAPSEVRFTRRELRARTGFGHTQLMAHMRRLEEMEYVRVHRENKTFLFALAYDADRSPQDGIGRGSVGHRSAVGADREGVRDGSRTPAFQASVGPSEGHIEGGGDGNASYPR